MSEPPKRRAWMTAKARQNRLQVYLSDPEHDALRDHCHQRRVHMAEFARDAIAEKLAREVPAPTALSPPPQEPR